MIHETRLEEHAPGLRLLAGACLLLFGRRLFWLFVGVCGFLAGVYLVRRFLSGQSETVTLALGLGLGIVGACIAVFLQKLAVGIAGFYAGGYLARESTAYGTVDPKYGWLVFLVGGVVGGMLVAGLFDWALMILSSLMGASIITRVVQPGASIAPLVVAGLCIVGIVVQAGLARRGRARAVEES